VTLVLLIDALPLFVCSFVDLAANVETVGGDYYGDVRRRTQYTRTVVDLEAPVGSREAVVGWIN
jgi:hypothetical protein